MADCIDDLGIKSTCCSSRDLEFSSPDPGWELTKASNSNFRHSPDLCKHCTPHGHVPIDISYAHCTPVHGTINRHILRTHLKKCIFIFNAQKKETRTLLGMLHVRSYNGGQNNESC